MMQVCKICKASNSNVAFDWLEVCQIELIKINCDQFILN